MFFSFGAVSHRLSCLLFCACLLCFLSSIVTSSRYGKAKFFWDVPATPLGVADVRTLLNRHTLPAPSTSASGAVDSGEQPQRPLSTNETLLLTPRSKKTPGPVPAPPRAPLPPPPPESFPPFTQTSTKAAARSTKEGSEAAVDQLSPEEAFNLNYNEVVAKYNTEAQGCFEDWNQFSCPNWRPIVVRLAPAQIQLLVNAQHSSTHSNSPRSKASHKALACLTALGLKITPDEKLKVQEVVSTSSSSGGLSAMAEALVTDPSSPANPDNSVNSAATADRDGGNQGGGGNARVLPNDTLWFVAVSRTNPASEISKQSSGAEPQHQRSTKDKGKKEWSSRRIYANSPEEAEAILSEAAMDCCVFSGLGSDEDRASFSVSAVQSAVAPEAALCVVLKRGCAQRFANEKILIRHMEKCCPQLDAAARSVFFIFTCSSVFFIFR